MNTCDIIQLFLLICTIIGLLWTISNNTKEVSLLQQQMKLSFYADYTKRYQEIILNFPENINDSSFELKSLEPMVQDKTMRYMRAFFDLCSEEFYLSQKSFIDEEIWSNWQSGMEYAFTKPAFKQAWIKIKADTKFYPSFNDWITPKLENSKSK